MFKKILVPVDGSEGSLESTGYCCRAWQKFGGELHVINVIQPYNNAALLAVPLDQRNCKPGQQVSWRKSVTRFSKWRRSV